MKAIGLVGAFGFLGIVRTILEVLFYISAIMVSLKAVQALNIYLLAGLVITCTALIILILKATVIVSTNSHFFKGTLMLDLGLVQPCNL